MKNDFLKLTSLERLLYKELYRKDLHTFIRDFWDEVEPHKFVDGTIVDIFSEIFMYASRTIVPCQIAKVDIPKEYEDYTIINIADEDKRNFCVNIPPRHTKSLIFSVFGPVWLWINSPIKVASISHTYGLSGELNGKRQKLINSERFKFFFNDIVLESNSGGLLRDTRGGEMYAKCRQSLLGFGADLIIADDIVNAEAAKLDRQEMSKAWNFFSEVLPSRFNDINTGIALNIQQRLAINDVTGRLMNDSHLSSTYSFIVLPAQFKQNTVFVCPISGKLIVYKKGDYLWPERFGDYAHLKNQITNTAWETMYLQNPIASDAAIIKNYMILEQDKSDVPSIDVADVIYASHDFPIKDKDTSDFLGSTLSYRVGSTLYFLDCLEKKMAFVKSVAYVKALDNRYPGIIQVIEDKANGSPILQQLQDEVPGMQAYQPGTASKTQRLESASLYMSSGNVVFVRNILNPDTKRYELSAGLQNLKERLLNFPFVEHDDITDAFSQQVLFTFMDRRYMVYGRAFNERNIVDCESINSVYSNVFFNREGDTWKVLEIAIQYESSSKLIVTRETKFRASVDEAMKKLKEFAPSKNVFIDCSATEALKGFVVKNISVERYEEDDFDASVAKLNLAFGQKQVLLSNTCVLTKSDIENFKFSKSKDESVKYASTKDGFIACIRIALKFYGGIV